MPTKLELHNYQGSKICMWLSLFSLICTALLGTNLYVQHQLTQVPFIAFIWLMVWLGLAIIFTTISFKEFVIGYLCALFCLIIAWRIAVIIELSLLRDLMFLSFLFMLINFIYCAWRNIHQPSHFLHPLSMVEWQVIFVRLYIGFDFIPHFTEKLFSGPSSNAHVVQAFIDLGVPDPALFVYLAGLSELISTISIGLGLFIRPGALFCTTYLLIATYLGHHFSFGFMWIMPGGGWEFALLWSMLIFSFAISGAHTFSIDEYLEDRFKLSLFLRRLL